MALMLVFYGALVPFAAIPWAPVDGFIPAVEGMISVADLVTAVLLFSQFSVSRSPPLLMLACGYLFSALIVIPHILTFPGAFAPLGAGPQSAGWLYVFWHLGFPVAVIGYALLKNEKGLRRMIQGSTRTTIGWSVMLVAGLVCAITWLVIAHSDLLPIIFIDERTYITQANFFSGFDVLMGIVALVLLWTRRVSVLDHWLMVSICAFLLEVAVVTLLDARFNVGFYSSRAFSVISATVLLVVLLTEAIGLYARATGLNAKLSQTLTSLQRERESKLLSLQAIGGAIAHEMNQPITAIALEGNTALKFLKAPPNVEEIGFSLNAIIDEAFRASEVLKSIRDLFKGESNEMETIDGNAILSKRSI
jgi:signal transduction histidine kinase